MVQFSRPRQMAAFEGLNMKPPSLLDKSIRAVVETAFAFIANLHLTARLCCSPVCYDPFSVLRSFYNTLLPAYGMSYGTANLWQ